MVHLSDQSPPGDSQVYEFQIYDSQVHDVKPYLFKFYQLASDWNCNIKGGKERNDERVHIEHVTNTEKV